MVTLQERLAELRTLPHCVDFAAVDVVLGPRFGARPAIVYRRTDVPVPPPGSPAAARPHDYPAPEPVGLELCIAGPLPVRFARSGRVLWLPESDHTGWWPTELAGEWVLTYGSPYGWPNADFPGWHRLDYTTWRPMGRFPEIYADQLRHTIALRNYGRLVSVSHVAANW